jgi:amino acid adenylation domain-containing protein
LADLPPAASAPADTTPSASFTGVEAVAAVIDERLLQWNATDQPLEPGARVESWVRRQVATTPANVAVIAGDRQMTFAQLQERTDRIAHVLRGRGVQPGHFVGLCLDRDVDLLPALLAVLTCGAAYVPLDPNFPRERLRTMAEDAELAALITQAAHAELVGLPRERQLRLDDDADLIATAPNVPPPPAVGSDALAYLIYTSGSTGKPKGVAVPQGALCNLLASMLATPGMRAGDRLLAVATLSFDMSVPDVFLPLVTGAAVVLASREDAMNGQALASLIDRHDVNMMQATPTTWHLLLEAHWRPAPGFRALFGGEPLQPALAASLLDLGIELWNLYGPTETTVWSTLVRITDARAPITIGHPIDNTQVWIVDEHLRPLPVGAEGEICIGGDGVARGYHRRPELTAEKFVRLSFGHRAGEVAYRTGDLGRWREDGTLEHLGRLDFQVKIRGYRIELGEIETQLEQSTGVARAVVVAKELTPGDLALVGYLVPRAGAGVKTDAIREQLREQLPAYMIPRMLVELAELPLLPNGKVDRKHLPDPTATSAPALFPPAPMPAGAAAWSLTALEAVVCEVFRETLGIAQVGVADSFFDLGGNSLLVTRAVAALARRGVRGATVAAFFGDPTPRGITRQIAPAARAPGAADRDPAQTADAIAIIGMAGRFPGASDVESFWDNLVAGRDSITRFARSELDPSLDPATVDDPCYVAARGFIEGVELFDAGFFGIAPKEAEVIDPQQRVFLEIAWECLERAGYAPGTGHDDIGVFAGVYSPSYLMKHLWPRPEVIRRIGELPLMFANDKDYVAARVAHRLDLRGPAISVHTACSTSLVAVVSAIDSLRLGRCSMALAGGASITCPPRSGYPYLAGAMLSPDGRTRAFDARGEGTVFSDGAAIVLLKRLSDAVADGDTIHAVIRGGATNNDGGAKASFTAPSVEGQAAVIAAAHADAGIRADAVSYIEAHGTATPLGDPIEVAALTRVFRSTARAAGVCHIGSVKTNVGHLVTAAGAAGLIKTALALEREVIPASLHFEEPNPKMDLAASPFVVAARRTPWPRSEQRPRLAGVSSFGVGGTNAHVVLEEAPARPDAPRTPGPAILRLSARSERALDATRTRLLDHLSRHPNTALADAAYTLDVGRARFRHRLAVVAHSVAEAVEALQARTALPAGPVVRGVAATDRPEVVFLFPGQGAQYPHMGAQLQQRDPVFAAAFEECLDAFEGMLGYDLRAALQSADSSALTPTAVTQPATFCIEYALARYWIGMGLVPAALIGHSIGEFVAATLAGVMTLSQAARLVALRANLMQARAPGAMLAVRLSEQQVTQRLPAQLDLAAVNAPAACVVSGPTEAIVGWQATLEAEGVTTRRLMASHGFHSRMMDDALAAFEAAVGAAELRPPATPIISTMTGNVLAADEATDPSYWSAQLRNPVRFSQALLTALQSPAAVFLEVGPRNTLSSLVRQHRRGDGNVPAAASSLGDAGEQEVEMLLRARAHLWTMGVEARRSSAAGGRRIPLPTYPFERQRHWLDAVASRGEPSASPSTPSTSIAMPTTATPPAAPNRLEQLLARCRALIEDVSGIDMAEADGEISFVEQGLDSLTLTQVATQLKREFKVEVTFRDLMEKSRSLNRLAQHLDSLLPPDVQPVPTLDAPVGSAPSAAAAASRATACAAVPNTGLGAATALPVATFSSTGGAASALEELIQQQLALMGQQLAALSGRIAAAVPPPVVAFATSARELLSTSLPPAAAGPAASAAPAQPTLPAAVADELPRAQTYDVKQAFGAIARIHTNAGDSLTERQRARLGAFMQRYAEKTRRSKEFTQANRNVLADPRVVNGFRPQTKEIVYQIVVDRSKGARVWDLDGNEYVDALSGFGMGLFGWQPDFVLDAVKRQLEQGYEIGPQHPLAADVARLVCELTGHDRAGLCNTGSEAVMGAVRIARTVTGRSLIATFSNSYHGIFDEVIVRGNKKLKAIPAAPGIMPASVENVIVLDYGAPESLKVLQQRGNELAAVLVEPVQSRRPELQPRDFLRELRTVTSSSGSLLIFDEVITGFRAHLGGAQAMFGVRADVASYGKVIGGGFPIGVIAGQREYMDALDGGAWQYGDDSMPTVGVTYFAGTFVRHPLALAAAKASLEFLKAQGPALQERLNTRTAAMSDELNAFCREVGAPVEIKHFASLWRISFKEDHPLQDLLFSMMRLRGVHILDNFPCYLTTAHTDIEVAIIKKAFKDSVAEMQESEFLPRHAGINSAVDPSNPPVAGARLGRDPQGKPAWFVPNPDQPGKFMKLEQA